MPCNFTFIALEKTTYSLFLIIFNIITFISLIFMFSEYLKFGGIEVVISVVLSDFIEAILMLIVLRYNL